MLSALTVLARRRNKAPRRRDVALAENLSDRDAAIAFWQAEVHQFEFRAGEQGALAQGMISAAAALATTAAGVFAAVTSLDLNGLNLMYRIPLLALPATLFLLWATGLRLLGEADLLRECVRHAELQLEQLCSTDPHLRPYVSWARVGLKHDMRLPFIILWGLMAIVVSLIGVFGTTLYVGMAMGSLWWIPSAVACVPAILMLVVGIENGIKAKSIRAELARHRIGGTAPH